MTTYPDYIGKEAVRRLNEARRTIGIVGDLTWKRHSHLVETQALCQLLTETGFKEPEPRDLVFARRICAAVDRSDAAEWLAGEHDNCLEMTETRALLREYAGEEA